MNRITWIASVGVTTSLAIGCLAWAEDKGGDHADHGEKKLALKDLPAPVQEAILKSAGFNAVLYEFAVEKDGGKTIYEGTFAVDKVNHTVSVSETGAILEEEIDVDVKGLPAPVTDALLKRYGTAGTIKKAESVKAGDKSFFEVELVAGKEEHEIKLGADGAIISDVVEPDEDHEGHQKNRGKEHDEEDDDHDGDKKDGDKD